jgi:hypothetical protein
MTAAVGDFMETSSVKALREAALLCCAESTRRKSHEVSGDAACTIPEAMQRAKRMCEKRRKNVEFFAHITGKAVGKSIRVI